MHVVIAGASGLIGTALRRSLIAQGHHVTALVRRPAVGSGEAQWDPAGGRLDPAALQGADAVVNLAGAGVGDRRWTESYKQEILQSRLAATSTIVNALGAELPDLPRVLINASAIGYYGDRGTEVLPETAAPGHDFLADVVVQWEAAAAPAANFGVRTAMARTGLVMTATGGAFAKQLPLFKLGLGGKLGDGRQYWPVISLADEVAALEFLIHSDIAGPVNLCIPQSPTNAEFTAELARQLGRPALLPAPAFALRAALGEFAAGITGSSRVVPAVLQAAGFRWQHPDLAAVIRAALG